MKGTVSVSSLYPVKQNAIWNLYPGPAVAGYENTFYIQNNLRGSSAQCPKFSWLTYNTTDPKCSNALTSKLTCGYQNDLDANLD